MGGSSALSSGASTQCARSTVPSSQRSQPPHWSTSVRRAFFARCAWIGVARSKRAPAHEPHRFAALAVMLAPHSQQLIVASWWRVDGAKEAIRAAKKSEDVKSSQTV